jgi:NAD(P)-dependent dehydrogenase (short-subunit alcohol dehydrogenase family)
MSRLQGRHTVITGAASGIGAETARLFVAEGASVVLADLEIERGQKLAAELGDRARFVQVDVAEEGAIERAIDESVSTFGSLDVLFNNAGNPGSLGRVEDIDMALFDRTVAIHLRGVFLGIRAAARIMRPQGHGSIINTASVAGLRANYGGHDYSAAKAAIAHLTRTTANELGEDGVRVNAICPGGIATSIFGRGAGLDADAAESTIAVMEVVLADVAPMKRSGQPLDIAECALWLASDSSSFVNGQAIAVDGGLVTGPTYRTSRSRTELMVPMLADIPNQAQ